jgi:endonuclease/exonuclease/phosphatase family metal-dependent hydrolase
MPEEPAEVPPGAGVDDLADPAAGPYGRLLGTRLRVMTWNLWWRFGPWQARRHAIAATLASVDADIIALQEIWGADGVTLAGELASEFGFSSVHSSRLELDGVTFGNAVLARWPISKSEWRPLPAPPSADESRTVLMAEVEGPRGAVQVFCTHLNWRFDQSDVRQQQVRAVAEFVSKHRGSGSTFPPVLCGDFNATPGSDEIRMLTGRMSIPVAKLVFHDAWEVAGTGGDGMTWSNTNPYARRDLEPDRRIDYVFAGWPKAGGAGNVTRCSLAGTEPVGGVVPSDHYAVVAELRY